VWLARGRRELRMDEGGWVVPALCGPPRARSGCATNSSAPTRPHGVRGVRSVGGELLEAGRWVADAVMCSESVRWRCHRGPLAINWARSRVSRWRTCWTTVEWCPSGRERCGVGGPLCRVRRGVNQAVVVLVATASLRLALGQLTTSQTASKNWVVPVLVLEVVGVLPGVDGRAGARCPVRGCLVIVDLLHYEPAGDRFPRRQAPGRSPGWSPLRRSSAGGRQGSRRRCCRAGRRGALGARRRRRV
jgi:hypothetical protein